MEQSWGNVEEVLKDFALMFMNTGLSKHCKFAPIDYFKHKIL